MTIAHHLAQYGHLKVRLACKSTSSAIEYKKKISVNRRKTLLWQACCLATKAREEYRSISYSKGYRNRWAT